MGCNCGKKGFRFVVVDGAGTCLLTEPDGSCTVYPSARDADTAARTAGLGDYRVRAR